MVVRANTMIAGNGSAGLAGSRRVSSDYAQFSGSRKKGVRFGVRLQTSHSKSHLLSRLEVEVRGGIGRLSRDCSAKLAISQS